MHFYPWHSNLVTQQAEFLTALYSVYYVVLQTNLNILRLRKTFPKFDSQNIFFGDKFLKRLHGKEAVVIQVSILLFLRHPEWMNGLFFFFFLFNSSVAPIFYSSSLNLRCFHARRLSLSTLGWIHLQHTRIAVAFAHWGFSRRYHSIKIKNQ